MSIYICSPYSIRSPHFELALEVAQRHLDQGWEVYLGACNSAIPCCDVNRTHRLEVCSRCVGRRLYGLTRLSRAVPQLPVYSLLPGDLDRLDQWMIDFRRNPCLDSFQVDGFRFGVVVSKALEMIGARDGHHSDERRLQLLLLRSVLGLYRSTLSHLEAHPITKVCLFDVNSHPLLEAVVAACEFSRVAWEEYRDIRPPHFEVRASDRSSELAQAELVRLNSESIFEFKGIPLRMSGAFDYLTNQLESRPWLNRLLSRIERFSRGV